MSTAHDIIQAARSFRGVRFHHQGRTREAGLDCLGLLVVVATACGLEIEGKTADAHDRTDYGHNPDTTLLRQMLERYLVRVDVEVMQPADVGLFLIEGRPQHLGIITDYPVDGELGLIHAYAPHRKVIEHRLDEQWRTRLCGVYRFLS